MLGQGDNTARHVSRENREHERNKTRPSPVLKRAPTRHKKCPVRDAFALSCASVKKKRAYMLQTVNGWMRVYFQVVQEGLGITNLL